MNTIENAYNKAYKTTQCSEQISRESLDLRRLIKVNKSKIINRKRGEQIRRLIWVFYKSKRRGGRSCGGWEN
jgi:hypothetical protein